MYLLVEPAERGYRWMGAATTMMTSIFAMSRLVLLSRAQAWRRGAPA